MIDDLGGWRRHALPAVACAGIAVLVAGTFLPWLTSGRAERNSYAAGGAINLVLHVSGAADAALHLWPFVSLLGALSVALIVLGHAYLGGALALVSAVVAGGVAAAVLAHQGRGLIRPATQGPTTTLVGAVTTVLAVALYLVQLRLVRPRSARPAPSRRTP